jgi:hypothetical protein
VEFSAQYVHFRLHEPEISRARLHGLGNKRSSMPGGETISGSNLIWRPRILKLTAVNYDTPDKTKRSSGLFRKLA